MPWRLRNSSDQILTRKLAACEPPLRRLFYIAPVGTVCMSCILLDYWTGVMRSPGHALLILSLGFYGAAGYFLLDRAFLSAPASSLALRWSSGQRWLSCPPRLHGEQLMRNILIGLLAFTAGIAFAAPPAPPPVVIVAAEFGLFDDKNPGELLFEPAQAVPHRVGQRYGWIIEVATVRRSLSVREEYVLPAAATEKSATDAVSESLTVPMQRRNQVSQRQLVPIDGKIYGEWSVGPNEPAGHRRLQVLVEDRVAASFEFDVK